MFCPASRLYIPMDESLLTWPVHENEFLKHKCNCTNSQTATPDLHIPVGRLRPTRVGDTDGHGHEFAGNELYPTSKFTRSIKTLPASRRYFTTKTLPAPTRYHDNYCSPHDMLWSLVRLGASPEARRDQASRIAPVVEKKHVLATQAPSTWAPTAEENRNEDMQSSPDMPILNGESQGAVPSRRQHIGPTSLAADFAEAHEQQAATTANDPGNSRYHRKPVQEELRGRQAQHPREWERQPNRQR